jgi:hypothetical protein
MARSERPFKQQLREYLETERPAVIGETVWRDLLTRLAPISENYLRELLRATGLPFDQPFAGVRQHSFEELEESLRELLAVYTEANAAGNRELARYARRQVIGAKDRAKFLARNPRTPADKRSAKEEMAEWMLVWLENPEVFPAWVEARRRALHPEAEPQGGGEAKF